MRLINKSIYALALASMMGLWSCSQEEMLSEVANPEGKTVKLTLTVNRAPQTRTSLSEVQKEDGTGLLSEWNTTDKLGVIASVTGKVGILEFVEYPDPNNKSVAVFEGTLTGVQDGPVQAKIYYCDESVIDKSSTQKKVVISLADQKFHSLEALAAMDVLHKNVTLNVSGNNATVVQDEIMQPMLALAHFNLSGLPNNSKGTLYITNKTAGKIQSGAWLRTYDDGALSNGFDTFISELKAEVNEDHQVYMALPAQYSGGKYAELTLSFRFVSTSGDEYTYSFTQPTRVTAGLYYTGEYDATTSKTNGIEIPLEKAVEDDPDSPGNMKNWGGNHGSTGSVPSFVFASYDNDLAWASNTRSLQDFGWYKTSTPRYNAIKDGHLISWDYGDGHDAKYFQYGRLLGFPLEVISAEVTMLSYYKNQYAKYPFGMTQNTNSRLYYCWSGSNGMNSRPTYAVSDSWNSGMTPQQAINSSIIYVTGDGVDYLKSSYRSKNWAERSGNPCPDGYRIPTIDELDVFVPSKSFESTLVENKTINNANYCVRWRKISNTKVGVTSVRTNNNITSATDPIFSNNDELILQADGFLYCWYEGGAELYTTGELLDDKYKNHNVGFYWASGIVKEGSDYCGDGIRVLISSNEVRIEKVTLEPVIGACIIPIKDSQAKATGFQPWFPSGY